MKNKKLVIIIVAFSILVVTLLGWFLYLKLTPKKEEITKITPLMYEVTKDGSNNKIYLFGSIHMIKPSDLHFPNYIMDAYNQSHYLACEMDIDAYTKDTEQMIALTQQMLYTDGTTIKDHINRETYNKLVQLLTKKEMYSQLLEMYKPVFFQSYLLSAMASDINLSATSSVDTYFIQKAKKDNKQVLEIEGGDFQMNLLLNTSDRLNEIMLNDIVENYDQEVQSLKELYAAWKTGDVEKILTNSNDEIEEKASYSQEDLKLIEEYNYQLLDERNINMTNKLMEYFSNNQDTFYMVGAAHLVGDKGIANLLKDKGYNVKRITD